MSEKLNIKPQQIELPTINVEQYAGQKTKIAEVEYHKNETLDSYYAKVISEEVAVIEGAKEPIVIKATRNCGLAQDKNGVIGWGKETKTGNWLKYMKVDNFEDLIGKEVTIKLTEPDKDGKVFLTF